jgi:hypothetical protein
MPNPLASASPNSSKPKSSAGWREPEAIPLIADTGDFGTPRHRQVASCPDRLIAIELEGATVLTRSRLSLKATVTTMERTLSPDEIAAKKKQRELKGQANMARYLQQQQETLNKTERLRALRLAQGRRTSDPIKPTKQSPKPKQVEPRHPLPGLHKGVRDWS